ncbi:MAG: hypothetical protein FWD64_01665 [Acidobacteriaceae bacterium]|nr:hypothetical protein [Acidobacteriaceae bacterium]
MKVTGKKIRVGISVLAAVFAASVFVSAQAADGNAKVSVKWADVTRVSSTVPTTQILAHRNTLRTHPMHDPEFKALEDLKTNDTRLQAWYSIPIQAVPELKEPTDKETFWDFKYLDDLMEDFYAHTTGRHHVNIGTVPRWMFNVPSMEVPTDPNVSFYNYTNDDTKGTLLKDPDGKQFADYQARIYQWYTQGGFTDELGKEHKSGHHYKIDTWGVMNETWLENKINVQQYTKLYDAVVKAIHKIDPSVEFYGPEPAMTEIPWARYFLDPKNHDPEAVPLIKWFSFHNYVNSGNDPSKWHEAYFTAMPKAETGGASAKGMESRFAEVMKIRDQLSPHTQVIMDEGGTFDALVPKEHNCKAEHEYKEYHPLYWNATGANWAATYIVATKMGVPLISMSQMDGYPTQCPSISMMNNDSMKPNSHYWALWLITHNFGPGDKVVATESSTENVFAQAYITPAGRRVMLINTTDQPQTVDLAGVFKAPLKVQVVDQASGEQEPRKETLKSAHVTLAPFAVAVVSGL